MRYIFYADVYFIQNFMIKVAVLYLALYCNNKQRVYAMTRKVIGKIIFASFVGTFIEIVGLMYCGSYHVFTTCVHLLEVPLMVWFVLGKERRQMMRVVVTGYFFIMLINGVLEVLWNQFGQNGTGAFCRPDIH